jgi:ComF family protein
MKAAAPIRRWMGRLASPLTDLIFPPQCWATRVPIAAEDLGLASEARLQIARAIALPYCRRCGMTTGPHTAHARGQPCLNCARRNLGVASIARVGTFDPPLSDLVRQFKFHRRWELAALLAPFLVQAINLQTAAHNLPVTTLVPVPLHWRRRMQRGFDQAEELARAAGALAGVRVARALRRIRATHEQSLTQSAAQRAENLRRAFVPRKVDLAGAHVWLIDDVCTTGATLHAAVQALRSLPRGQRPAAVYAGVLCVTDHADTVCN